MTEAKTDEPIEPVAWMYHYKGAEFDARLQTYEGMSCEEEDVGMIETPLYPAPTTTAEQLAEAQCEIARLREALIEITNYGDRAAVQIARSALEPKP